MYTYALWEEDFRRRLAEAHRCAERDLRYPLLGDLRRLRNDVVHHRGIASRRNTGKCEVLGQWFKVGDFIRLGAEDLAEFMDQFPWEPMEAGPAGGL